MIVMRVGSAFIDLPNVPETDRGRNRFKILRLEFTATTSPFLVIFGCVRQSA